MRSLETEPSALSRLDRAHRLVAAWVESASDPTPATVLTLGGFVLLHGAIEDAWLFDRQRWLDPAAVARLRSEHDQFAEDLDLLRTLMATEPASPDLRPLARALFSRLREHVCRDARVFYSTGAGRAADHPAPSDE